MHFKLLIGALR